MSSMTSLAGLSWPRNTDRLDVRPATADDAAELYAWQSDPAVSLWMPSEHTSPEQYAAWLTERLPETLVARLDGRIVAAAKLHVEDAWAQDEIADRARNTQAEVGWSVDPLHQGRGIATELAAELLRLCFAELGVRRVVAVCFADNAASWRIMEKLGMRKEAHFVADSLHRDGRWLDSAWYALLDDEWKQHS
jgi:RimJ/RimL family protein N-acetyltransferase